MTINHDLLLRANLADAKLRAALSDVKTAREALWIYTHQMSGQTHAKFYDDLEARFGDRAGIIHYRTPAEIDDFDSPNDIPEYKAPQSAVDSLIEVFGDSNV